MFLEQSKSSVESYDDRIDPVGACVGTGARIHGIARELRNENIDVINLLIISNYLLRDH